MHSGGRRGVAVVLLLGGLGLVGCGEQESPDVAVEATPTATSSLGYRDPTETPDDEPAEVEPTGTPTSEPPELDSTALEANMARLSPADRELVDHYLGARGEDRLGEGTWIVAAPMTVDEAVLRLFGPDPETADEADDDRLVSGAISAYT